MRCIKSYLLLFLVVINDYDSAFDGLTLIQVPLMISRSDFQPLSVAKINIFHQQPVFYRKKIQ